MDAKAF